MSDQTPGDAVPAVAWLAVIDTTATDIMVVVCSLVEVGDRVAGICIPSRRRCESRLGRKGEHKKYNTRKVFSNIAFLARL